MLTTRSFVVVVECYIFPFASPGLFAFAALFYFCKELGDSFLMSYLHPCKLLNLAVSVMLCLVMLYYVIHVYVEELLRNVQNRRSENCNRRVGIKRTRNSEEC